MGGGKDVAAVAVSDRLVAMRAVRVLDLAATCDAREPNARAREIPTATTDCQSIDAEGISRDACDGAGGGRSEHHKSRRVDTINSSACQSNSFMTRRH